MRYTGGVTDAAGHGTLDTTIVRPDERAYLVLACLGAWVLARLGTRCLGTWVLGYLGTWVLGLSTCVFGYLSVWGRTVLNLKRFAF
jgi:hypothetical protein